MRSFGMSQRAKSCRHESQSGQYHIKRRHESLQMISSLYPIISIVNEDVGPQKEG